MMPITSFSSDHPDSLTSPSPLTISISHHLLHGLWASQSKYIRNMLPKQPHLPNLAKPHTSSVSNITVSNRITYNVLITVHHCAYIRNDQKPEIKLNHDQPSTTTTTQHSASITPQSQNFGWDNFTSIGTIFHQFWSKLVEFPHSAFLHYIAPVKHTYFSFINDHHSHYYIYNIYTRLLTLRAK